MKQYHKNPRRITKKQYADLERWLRELGDLSGIVHDLNTDEIIGGNQRSRVFDINKCEIELTNGPHEPDEQGTVALGWVIWEGKRYAYRQVRWTPEQCEKANIVANKAGGEWDFDILANQFEFDDLLEWGFSEEELTGLEFGEKNEPGEDPGPQIDRAEELREKWGVEAGQLWQLGEHRIICGDCTDPAVVERVMQGEKAGAVVADPPYGMNLDTDYSDIKGSANAQIQGREGKKYAPVIGDDEDYDPRPVMKMFDKTDEQFWWGADYYAERIPDKNKGSWIVWDKRVSEDADKIIGACFELCWSKKRHKRDIARIKWIGAFGYADARERTHPTQKPIALIEWILERYTESDTIVVDPYTGSGTTLIACERLGRKCRAIEISPAYVAVALERWSTMTGLTPKLVD